MDAAKTVTAVFAVDQYALNVVVTGQGSVALNPPGGTYDAGMVVTLMATPAAGWRFDHWEGALSGGATGVQITMDAAKEVTAVFEREQYTLDVSAEGGGSVSLDPPGGAYPSGTVVTLTPNPNAGNRFEIWGGELAGTRQPATITMDANKYVQAFFMAETFTSFSPYSLCAVGSTLYFLGTGAYSGQELWKTDGAFAGTTLVKDIAPGHDNAGILFLTNLEETLYFFAVAGGRYGLWTSDGTEAGTVEVTGLDGSSPAMPPLRIGENLYFSASGTENGELWVTDGTAEGTGIVKSFGPASGMQYTNPNNLTNVDGVLYFNNSPQNELFTLWKSDGTEEGTVAVYSSRWLSEIAGLNGQALFYAGSETNDGALLTTDGTPQGTQDLYHFDFGPGDLEVSGGLLFFGAQLNWFNTQVWASNGAAVYKVDGFSYRPWDLTDVDGTLFYMALYDVESQPHCGLFATTGTGGTLVREINPHLFYGYGSEMEDVDGTLFFTAENSYGGVGLWKSDGTTPGTVLVSDITPVPVGIIPYELTAVDDTLFFSAADETYGHQLWKSDGTPAGTLPISCPVP
jgi:ELWxxDGT repeat protein